MSHRPGASSRRSPAGETVCSRARSPRSSRTARNPGGTQAHFTFGPEPAPPNHRAVDPRLPRSRASTGGDSGRMLSKMVWRQEGFARSRPRAPRRSQETIGLLARGSDDPRPRRRRRPFRTHDEQFPPGTARTVEGRASTRIHRAAPICPPGWPWARLTSGCRSKSGGVVADQRVTINERTREQLNALAFEERIHR